ncbi:histidine-rich glycoprotein-like [Leguminivora glycinivorella]|uniref:histidine-rich glycoprotein-like n=1 Tax=Leguminivora glycinivorella TaxID=1035111 RepID=UPI0020101884|nr:histidine-rich glycoprotein-like [Leguminivora glycinivorella]
MFSKVLCFAVLVATVVAEEAEDGLHSHGVAHWLHGHAAHGIHHGHGHHGHARSHVHETRHVIPIHEHHEHGHHEHEHHKHPKYEFEYSVEDPHTHDIKMQQEHRDDDVVKGRYSLHQPDGHVRHVEYHADKHG